MHVYKFGGGVLKDQDGICRMVEIIKASISEPGNQDLMIVVSALGKMTNAFEKLWSDWISQNDFSTSFEQIKAFHLVLADSLLIDDYRLNDSLMSIFEEIESILKSPPPEDENESYDQLVCYGEILSSEIISVYFEQIGLDHSLIDARKVVCTDSSFRDARVNWIETEQKIKEELDSISQSHFSGDVEIGKRIWISQGFIGANEEGKCTTLGREGSDFSAAIFAYVLDAAKVLIWKDVPGVMTGDPVDFPNAGKLNQISYLEAIELSYFGAKILHPNTIKPLQNKNIPLLINSIFSPEEEGTRVIKKPVIIDEKPVIIIKPDQVLISIQPRDFSFVMEEALSQVFAILAKHDLRVNLLQHGAVSLSLCLDYHEDHLNRLIGDLIVDFKVLYNSGLDLLTIRHYTAEAIEGLTNDRRIYIQQQSRKTARFVMA